MSFSVPEIKQTLSDLQQRLQALGRYL